jgi:hypothetical protein
MLTTDELVEMGLPVFAAAIVQGYFKKPGNVLYLERNHRGIYAHIVPLDYYPHLERPHPIAHTYFHGYRFNEHARKERLLEAVRRVLP